VKLTFSSRGWAEYLALQGEEPEALERTNEIIKQCMPDPFRGIGKPEALRGNLKGWWSRRITREHRLVYRVTGSGDAQALEIAQCRYHY